MLQGIGAKPHRYVRTCFAYFSPLLQSIIRTTMVNVKLQNIIRLVMFIINYYIGVKCAHMNSVHMTSCSLYNNRA